MTTVNTGIFCKNTVPTTTNNILSNMITGCNNGISLLTNEKSIINIKTNMIENVAVTGISFVDFTTVVNSSLTTQYVVEKCTIKVKGNLALNPLPNNNAVGIYAHEVAAYGTVLQLCGNKIELPDQNSGANNKGILINHSHGVNVRKNIISQAAAAPSLNHTGIYYENCNLTQFDCNSIQNTNVGMSSNGSNISMAIEKNNFYDHTSVGLLINGLSLPAQANYLHKGNLWHYATNASMPGAKSNLDPTLNAFMQFIVDVDENAGFLPFVDGQDLFVDDDNPVATTTCIPVVPIFCSSTPFEPGSNGPPQALINEVINNQPVFSLLDPVGQWLRKIDALSETLGQNQQTLPSGWANFLSQNANTSQGKMAEINHSFRVWHESTTTVLSDIENKITLTNASIQNQSASVQSNKPALELAIFNYFEAKKLQLDAAIGINNAMPSTGEDFEVFSKQVNGIAFSHLKNPEILPSTSELTVLRNIADGCSKEEGPAVMTARAILLVVNNETFSDDCSAARLHKSQSRTVQNLDNGIKIFPNPNNGSFSVSYFHQIGSTAILQLLDLNGKIVLEKQIEANSLQPIHAEHLAKGVYFAKFVHPEAGSQTIHRIVIQ